MVTSHKAIIEKDIFSGKEETFYSIAFATVCMNRLHHIRQTLPKNIEDSSSYANARFFLLDYNSSDGLEDWVKENMMEHIQSGKLVFYRTEEPLYFNRSHSRNQILTQTDGDILCNVDADNYIGEGFAEYINREFNEDKEIFLAGNFGGTFEEYKDAYGRFCAWKEDFLNVGGYDEEMESYGHEDTDLYERLIRYGRRELNISEIRFLHSIAHSDKERTGNEFFRKNLYRFYLAYLGNHKRVLFLYKNGTFETGTLIENYYSLPSPSAIAEGGWQKGCWGNTDQGIQLLFNDGRSLQMITDNGHQNYTAEEKEGRLLYTNIVNSTLLYNMMLSYSIITNSNRIHLNETANKIKVNERKQGFGQGALCKNFNKNSSNNLITF